MTFHFVSDLHGHERRYRRLFETIAADRPAAVLLGGDLFPSGFRSSRGLYPDHDDFANDYLATAFRSLRKALCDDYPRVLLILGNDDRRALEPSLLPGEEEGLWEYLHGKKTQVSGITVYGYACVPPTPFMLKDWERYDVSRFVDPGSVAPEDGRVTDERSREEIRRCDIRGDLELLAREDEAGNSIFLFHAPPYKTKLDRAALDGKMIDHAPMDVHVGSIAMRRFIESRSPRVTLHGHIHESARLTGAWRDTIGDTHCFTAAHDGPELALVRFDPEKPEKAERRLI
jgi:uncharacterized protein